MLWRASSLHPATPAAARTPSSTGILPANLIRDASCLLSGGVRHGTVSPLPDQASVENDRHAHGDRAVGQIERGPVIRADVKIEEIDHVTEQDPVDEVARRAARDQPQREGKRAFPGPHHPDQQPRDDDGRETGQKPWPPGRIGLEQAETRTPVIDQHQVEERRHGQLVADPLEPLQHRPLDGLIGERDGERDRQPRPRHGAGHGTYSAAAPNCPTASAQRPQISG